MKEPKTSTTNPMQPEATIAPAGETINGGSETMTATKPETTTNLDLDGMPRLETVPAKKGKKASTSTTLPAEMATLSREAISAAFTQMEPQEQRNLLRTLMAEATLEEAEESVQASSATPVVLVGSVPAGDVSNRYVEDDGSEEAGCRKGKARAEQIISLLDHLLAEMEQPTKDTNCLTVEYLNLAVDDLPQLTPAARTVDGGAIFGNAIFGQSIIPITPDEHPMDISSDSRDWGMLCQMAFTAIRPLFVMDKTSPGKRRDVADGLALLTMLGFAAHRRYGPKGRKKAAVAPLRGAPENWVALPQGADAANLTTDEYPLNDVESDLIDFVRTGTWPDLVWDDPEYIAFVQKEGIDLEEDARKKAAYLTERNVVLTRLRDSLPDLLFSLGSLGIPEEANPEDEGRKVAYAYAGLGDPWRDRLDGLLQYFTQWSNPNLAGHAEIDDLGGAVMMLLTTVPPLLSGHTPEAVAQAHGMPVSVVNRYALLAQLLRDHCASERGEPRMTAQARAESIFLECASLVDAVNYDKGDDADLHDALYDAFGALGMEESLTPACDDVEACATVGAMIFGDEIVDLTHRGASGGFCLDVFRATRPLLIAPRHSGATTALLALGLAVHRRNEQQAEESKEAQATITELTGEPYSTFPMPIYSITMAGETPTHSLVMPNEEQKRPLILLFIVRPGHEDEDRLAMAEKTLPIVEAWKQENETK